MKKYTVFFSIVLLAVAFRAPAKAPEYKVCFGNTHAHCNYSGDIAVFRAKKGLSLDPKNSAESHYELAKENGYDFYFVTDHSQYPVYTPDTWAAVKTAAEAATDASFVALRGYEHSENDGPDGRGHMNVYNSSDYLNAMADGVSVEYFHNWLAKPEQADAIVCFNHPQKDAYNDFHCYNEEMRSRMKLIELINGGRAKFYPSFLNALAKGWKVSPVAGCDNHGWEGIAKWNARTGLLVTELTPAGVLEAMASRRTFATLDKNLSVVYRVNGKIMGSDIRAARKYKFDIEVSDPDTDRADQAIARIEVVSGSGTVVAAADFDSHEVHWKPVVPAGEKCYFVLVYNVSKPETPVAYAAPVWIEP
ncbi:CehA/McbA family metallohydrolase [Alistipes finegoldii]|uniref:CehA/McbA family metallohydrolase n=1 Tax=Alistipes finegoldii TaxID=214856 RepID=UPI0026757C5C|nr:CehA/McbA family metallohydrolase [Alistipes finegoldii]